MIVAWESIRGGPIELVTRPPGGSFSEPLAVSPRASRFASVAISSGGRVAAAWESNADGVPYVEIIIREPGLVSPGVPWVSQPGARRPQIAIAEGGEVLAVWTRHVGEATIVETAAAPPTGTWSAPQTITRTGSARDARLASAPDGTAAVTWTDESSRRVMSALRRRGSWTPAITLSDVNVASGDADVAIDNRGRATAAWIERQATGIAVVARQITTGGWGPRTEVGRASSRAKRVLRPRRADTGIDVASAPDGRAAVAWAGSEDGRSFVAVAVQTPDGAWLPSRRLSRATGDATSPDVQFAAGAVAIAGWEEIDELGLLRARVTRVADGVSRCVELGVIAGETAGPRLVGGPAAQAAYVDLNRNEIRVAPVP